jgi:RHS repeat-associated protein
VVPGANGGATTFKYDPFGRRIQKSGPLGTTNYLYDVYSLTETIDGNGARIARYTQGRSVDEPLAAANSIGSSYYYQGDGVGSITSLSSPAGAILGTYIYDSFGNVTNSTGTLENPFQFTGREFDPETNLYYNRTRYYNPNTGRFVSEDPIHFKGGINFYPYAKNDPSVFVDPYGQSVWCPSWLPVCPDYYHNKVLLSNLENDQEILDMTETLALDPFCYGKPGVEQLVEIWQFERLNVIIDAIELGNASLSALDEIPGVDIPNSFDYDQEMEWLASLRERNNQQIDELLEEAAEAQAQARTRSCPHCRVK